MRQDGRRQAENLLIPVCSFARPPLEQGFAASVVRDIERIERAFYAAHGPMSDQLLGEIAYAMRGAAPAQWVLSKIPELTLTCPDWQSRKPHKRGDAWLQLRQVARDDLEQSWIAAATGSGPTSMCLELMVRKRLSPLSGKLQGNIALTESLLARGFELTEAGTRLIMPISIDVDELALAFETQDFHEAMEPVREATAMAVAAKPEIDELLDLLRGTAAAKKSGKELQRTDGPTRINVVPTHGSHAKL